VAPKARRGGSAWRKQLSKAKLSWHGWRYGGGIAVSWRNGAGVKAYQYPAYHLINGSISWRNGGG
jgi:hypothetical protein